MTTNIRFIIALSLLIFATLAGAMEGPPAHGTMKLRGKEIAIFLSEHDWEHIIKGQPTDNGFSGGHDYGYYFEKYIKRNLDAVAYFDANMNAYIVSSQKGDSLPTILDNLRNRVPVRYHTLFPPNVLTKPFVVNAFKKALQEGNIDFEENLFYTAYEDFKVAGRFTKTLDNYHIHTIFPDLTWHYRIDFRHHGHEPFAISRFLEWSPLHKAWIRQGLSKNVEDDEKEKYLPKPIFSLQNQNSENEGELKTAEFVAASRAKNKILTSIFPKKGNESIGLNILDLFFANPSNPTEEEFNNLQRLLNELMPEFRYRIPGNYRSKPIRTRVARLKMDLKNKLKTMIGVTVIRADNGEILVKNETLGIHQSGKVRVNGLHFAEEVLFEMLFLSSISEAQKESLHASIERSRLDFRIECARTFTANFMRTVGADEQIMRELQICDLVPNIRVITSTRGAEYALEVVARRSFTTEAMEKDEIDQLGIVIIMGCPDTPCELTFRSMAKK